VNAPLHVGRRVAAFGSCALLGAASLAVLAQGSGEDPVLKQERASLQAVCSKCHNLEIVTATPLSYQAWHDTVQTMIDRGAQASDEQLDDIMDYLHRTLTTVNVNTADPEELALVLDLPDAAVKAIVARRKSHRFDSLADLKTVTGLNGTALDAKSRLLFFK
jgi:Helix-hairpin-helix motif